MQLAVMDTAERHGETIADLAANCPAIGESDVVGVRWGATTDKARLTCNELQMSPVALAHRFFEDGDLLFDPHRLAWLAASRVLAVLAYSLTKVAEPGL